MVPYTRGMRERLSGVYVDTTRRVYKGQEYQQHLLRRSYREGGKVKKETISNITSLGDENVAFLKARLAGKPLLVAGEELVTVESRPHGHVQAVLTAMRRLDLPGLLSSRACREQDLVLGMVAQHLLCPGSKLAMVRSWGSTSLAEELGIADANENDLYHAMDWLISRKSRIEGKLARRHLSEGDRVHYDLSSTYFEGEKCPLVKFGHSRDRKRGKKQVNWGVMTTAGGIPLSVDLYPGNTNDAVALPAQVKRVKEQFGISDVTWVGDRRMITGKHIEKMSERQGVNWITALTSPSIKPLTGKGVIQPSFFDETNMFEFTTPDYPGERLIACRNPILARKREHARTSLLEATRRDLDKIKERIRKGRLKDKTKIGVAVGRVLGEHKMAKHIDYDIDTASFEYQVNQQSVNDEAATDGIYVIRTSLTAEELEAADVVRAYKDLEKTENNFEHMKTSLDLRPVNHHLEDRVKAHFFICLLAYYVRLHMEQAWASRTFKDENPPTGSRRHPVNPAERSPEAERKATTRKLESGETTHSFKTLLNSLATIVKNKHNFKNLPQAAFTTTTEATHQQQHALDLLETIRT